MNSQMENLLEDRDYQSFCREHLADPYPLYRRLRENDPVHWCEPMKLWLVTRYKDVCAGIRDPRFSTSRMGMYTRPLTPESREKLAPLLRHLSKWILLTDEPDHGRVRRLVNLAFTPRMVERLRGNVVQIVDELLEPLKPGETIDILNRFCYPLPAMVICEMLGIPQDQRETFRICTERLIAFASRGGPELARYADDAMIALNTLIQMFDRLIEEHRRKPEQDLMSEMIAAEENGDRLTTEELFAQCVFLFLAGHETTTSLLASGVLLLIEHPAQFAQLKQKPDELVGPAVEEFLRYEPSVPRAVRQASEPIDIDGKSIRQGDTVVFMIAAANRDPEMFADPDRLDIARHPNKHLSFGFGPHFCLGGQLARMELEVALRALASRLPDMSLATTDIRWKPLMGIRSLQALEIIG